MFEVIVGAVCLGVLAVEVIEVRQKCEESWWPGTRHDARPFQPEFRVWEDRFGAERSSQAFHPRSAPPTGFQGEKGGNEPYSTIPRAGRR
jgi:hypothetical protein